MLPFWSKAVLCGAALSLFAGCSSYQPTKNVWKGTRELWYTYVSPPAPVDYAKEDFPAEYLLLSQNMEKVDAALEKIERAMSNADRPPSQEWLSNFFAEFPWINGVAGIRYDGVILGREPEQSVKELDFNPLLYEDQKEGAHALRTDVQNTPFGPEILLAAPLYDGTEFLGLVVVHFDLRTLMHYVGASGDLVVVAPQALLWPGKYDFARTPLAGLDWNNLAQKQSSGVCSNGLGSFYYLVRYLGNVPLFFATSNSKNFPEGDGSLEQGLAFFPKERPKMPPPDYPERKDKQEPTGVPVFEKPEPEVVETEQPQPAPRSLAERPPVKSKPVRPTAPKTKRKPRKIESKDKEATLGVSTEQMPTLSGGRPSPFGPRDKQAGTSSSQASEAKEASSSPKMRTLPGGRPSPFGP